MSNDITTKGAFETPETTIKLNPLKDINPKIKEPKIFRTSSIPSSEGYDVYVGRGKKEQRIFKNLPKGLATKSGSEYILRDIKASFKLRPSGQQTTIKDINYQLPSMLRPGKRDINRIVERRRFRLDTPLEKAQINFAKKTKGGFRFK